jgi:hypothetical protein
VIETGPDEKIYPTAKIATIVEACGFAILSGTDYRRTIQIAIK